MASTGARKNAIGGASTFIPRMRWVDSVAETPGAGPAFGYSLGGGSPSGNLSTIERIDYSNDTATASLKGLLPLANKTMAATGNDSFGYSGGGNHGSTNLARIDYSNDTATAALKGTITATNYGAAVGNRSFGYFATGSSNSNTSIERVDYSNDTPAASPKGPLTHTTWDEAAIGNNSYGYFLGGFGPGTNSNIDRIDYANDTATASLKGTLTAPSGFGGMAATGNANFGYSGGGGPSPKSFTTRLDYSNDTATVSVRGNMTIQRTGGRATGSQSFGYFFGALNTLNPSRSSYTTYDYSNRHSQQHHQKDLSQVIEIIMLE